MKPLVPTALAAMIAMAPVTPVLAQEAEGPTVLERGLRLFMEGLLEEMEPAMRDMEDLAEDAAPLLDRMRRDLAESLEGFEGIGGYEAPEMLPNGDILIRRKRGEAGPDDAPLAEPNADGSIDL